MNNGLGKGGGNFTFLEPYTSQKQTSNHCIYIYIYIYIYIFLVAILAKILCDISENCNSSNVLWILLVLGDN